MTLESVAASAPSARTSPSSTPAPSVPSRASIAATSRAVVRSSEATRAGTSGPLARSARVVCDTVGFTHPPVEAWSRNVRRPTPKRSAMASADSAVFS